MNYITNPPLNFKQDQRLRLVLTVQKSEVALTSALEALNRFDCDWSRRNIAVRDAREASKRIARLGRYLTPKTTPAHQTKAGARLARHCGIPVHLAESLAPLAGMKAEG